VKNGVVALSGYVGSYAERRAAEEAAQSIAGVKAVANDIAVEFPSDTKRSDAEIAEAAVNALKANVCIPADSIKVFVHDGWVTLEGQVAMWYQKTAAETALTPLHGVKGISDNITISSRVFVSDVESKIEDAFRRRAHLDARKIAVTALDGTVTLEGEVHSWQERNQAEIAAWQAPGVSQVIDKLTVQP